jgi:hypothetical protein
MPKDAYPETVDLIAFAAEGNVVISPTQAANAILAGIRSVETKTGRHFLAGMSIENAVLGDDDAHPGEVERVLAPSVDRQGYISLHGDLAAAPPLVTYTPGPDQDPETWLTGTDYRMGPLNALDKGIPFEWLEVKQRWWAPLGFDLGAAITVRGLWGYATSIPEDAWMAMLAAGMLWLVDMAAVGGTYGDAVIQKSDPEFTTRWQPSGAGVTGWKNIVRGAVLDYRKKVV